MQNPFSDFFKFLQMSTVWGRWPIVLFILLLIASIAIALMNLRRDAAQRTGVNVYTWLARLFVGGVWFQQTLWKLPPTFTDNPDGVSDGLHYWIPAMGKSAAFGFHRALVNDVVNPNFNFFAFQVWAVETFIAVSLMLGIFTRLGGLLGALMAINLWLGFYNAADEWPWAYFFLILLMGFFVAVRAGRALGLDAMIASRRTGKAGRIISLIT